LAVFVDLSHGLLIVKFHACNLILSKLNKPHFRLTVLVVNALLFVHLCRVLLVNACLGLLEDARIFFFLLLKFLIQARTLEHRSTVFLLYLFLLFLVCRQQFLNFFFVDFCQINNQARQIVEFLSVCRAVCAKHVVEFFDFLKFFAKFNFFISGS